VTPPSVERTPAEPASEAFGERYHRRGLGLRAEVKDQLVADYHSALVRRFRESGYRLSFGDLIVRLAREFGFCYGVERAVDYAYEAVRRFPDRRIVLTGEIIHNPEVNARLRGLGIRFLGDADLPDAGSLRPEDVVLLPAFGVTVGLFGALRAAGCVVVDTTCGSVLNVWKNVERYAAEGFTSVVHGKASHEETRATVSRVSLHPGGRYLVVLDLEEARLVAEVIAGRGSREAFLARFAGRASEGFDPARDLDRVGVANQTTMLSSESIEIARLLGDAFQERYGPEEGARRFRSFDTICTATQDRQDALASLIAEPLDLLLVVGGYNSSNTGHLLEMAEGRVPAYHIKGADCLLDADRIRHRPSGRREEAETRGWCPAGPVVVGLTAGASTPDSVIGAVVDRLVAVRGGDASRAV
jgi:4-hydroxy-3-methylbut-2-enyl diphosphate reductase